MMTVADLFRAIGDTPLLAVAILVVGVPVIGWLIWPPLRTLLIGPKRPH